MGTPLVSVITPTFNRADLLPAAIESVRNQTCSDLEMIVVDDGSTDGTPQAVAAFHDPRITYVGLGHTGKISLLRNAGLRKARGAFLAFLDSDDLWLPEKLQAQVNLLEAHPEAGFALCGFESFNATGTIRRNLYRPEGQAGTSTSLASIFSTLISGKMIIYTSTALIRRSSLDVTGPFNEELSSGDNEFFTRLAFHHTAAFVHLPLVRIRKHDGNTFRQRGPGDMAEAIDSVEHFYALGAIPRVTYTERILKYRYTLGTLLQERGELASARREFLTCIRLRPTFLRGWRRYAATLLRSKTGRAPR